MTAFDPGPPVASIETHLAVINTKLDALLIQRDDHENRIRKVEAQVLTTEQKQDTETRLRKLEQYKWVLLGAVIAGSSAVSALVNAVH